MFEEDFKTEREDRARVFAERGKKEEQYWEEIRHLQSQLDSHKGNLSGLEIIHQAQGKELLQALDDLKKCKEELHAKTTQVMSMNSFDACLLLCDIYYTVNVFLLTWYR